MVGVGVPNQHICNSHFRRWRLEICHTFGGRDILALAALDRKRTVCGMYQQSQERHVGNDK